MAAAGSIVRGVAWTEGTAQRTDNNETATTNRRAFPLRDEVSDMIPIPSIRGIDPRTEAHYV